MQAFVTQSVIQGSEDLGSLRNLLELQYYEPYLWSTESESLDKILRSFVCKLESGHIDT